MRHQSFLDSSLPQATIAFASILACNIARTQAQPPEADAAKRLGDRIEEVSARALPTERERAWRRIPWRESLTAALDEARRDHKPVYVFLSDGWFPTGSC